VLRPEIQALADQLVATGRSVLSLDEIAETLGATAIDSDEIDALFAFLEARGVTVGDPSVGLASSALPQVLTAARALRTELGRTPRVDEITTRSGLPEDAVRRALLFAQTLGFGLPRRG
jgi:Sigma-70 region 3/Sigma-70 factor, region 1.1